MTISPSIASGPDHPHGAGTSLPILVVDDEPALRGLIMHGLTMLGYRVVTAANVAEARECLRTRSFSLILSDFEMPGETGLDLLHHVAQVYPGLPFIMLTGHDESLLARSAIASGALDFLPKPFHMDALVRRIEQNWERLEQNRLHAAQLTEDVLTGTIRALVAAVDAKDPHTRFHSERVARYALRLGEAIQLPPERLRILEFAALLHDVGKIAVPESILLKPDRLSDAEWEVMKRHPVRSAEIVSQVGPLAEVAYVVRHHHERMDGNGYPDGLCGEAIPVFTRILAIADTFEAITSERAYRPARTAREAGAVIEEVLGTQLDERLGELFLKLNVVS